jgi:homoserine trans-succinylase
MARYTIILTYRFSYDKTMGILCDGITPVKDKDKNIVYAEGHHDYVKDTLTNYVLDFLHGNTHDISIIYMLERR